ncbi:MAG: transglutaminase-like domain-containing protein [Bacteroidales bacterium]
MKHSFRIIAALLFLVITGCSGGHLITDRAYRKEVDSCFAKTLTLLQNRKSGLANDFDANLSLQQKEALGFLYAFMPLNDLADYSVDFFLSNINMSLRARNSYPWGKSVPGDIFLHYVLPVRVNNENLDSFRIKYYDEICSRIKGKNMTDAALEINHWCHEKVTYQPSDSRTSAPMSTILSARGRCGEESTFTVSALRAAGIPARQVYTPRWAHCDDNHAWVEFWNDGKWSYMGACEPEPIVDCGWFTEPAKRAMLVNTRSFGASGGNENVINKQDKYSVVNNLSKYADTKRIYVKVIGSGGTPLKDAIVEYQLYNYAEFYPIASVPTDANGISSLETGFGDLLIWARKNDEFDFKKVSVGDIDTLVLNPGRNISSGNKFDYDLSTPVKRMPGAVIPAELAEENNRKLNEENSLRKKYTDSWPDHRAIIEFTVSKGLDTAKVIPLITRSMGNYKDIYSYIAASPDSLRKQAITLLEVVNEKDLRDTKREILLDHLMNCRKNSDSSDNKNFADYVLNPRIGDEMLSAWRSYILSVLPQELKQKAADDPSAIADFLNRKIKIYDDLNYSKTPITPGGVLKLGISDSKSRDICFVAIARSLGIPSRLEPGSNIPQFYFRSEWHDVYFTGQTKPSENRGFLKLASSEKNPVPEYYKNFTLARFENGRYNTMEYDENKSVNDFPELALIPGHYMLVTGNRLDDNRILASLEFFNIAGGEHKEVDIKIRHENKRQEVLGKAELTKILIGIDDEEDKYKSMAGRDAIIAWLETDKEPSRHVLNDFMRMRREFDSWGGAFVFFTVGGTTISPEERQKLPFNSLFSDDSGLSVLHGDISCKEIPSNNFPFLLLVNKNGDIIFKSEGYRIGTGEQILQILNSIK